MSGKEGHLLKVEGEIHLRRFFLWRLHESGEIGKDIFQDLVCRFLPVDAPVPPEPEQVLERDFQRRVVISLAVFASAKEFLHPFATHQALKPVVPDSFFTTRRDCILGIWIDAVAWAQISKQKLGSSSYYFTDVAIDFKKLPASAEGI